MNQHPFQPLKVITHWAPELQADPHVSASSRCVATDPSDRITLCGKEANHHIHHVKVVLESACPSDCAEGHTDDA